MADVTESIWNVTATTSFWNVTLPFEITESTTNSPWDDATWILTSAFIIFTMQSGFGLLESGMASRKNEVNIMMKNVVDVVFGGVTYWSLGYGLTFGKDEGSNPFNGVGYFFLNPDDENLGNVYSKFVFQASFATTATTIVSGAMAERTKLLAYVVFSLLNTFVYSFPAHWVWADKGWLKTLYVVDVAGVGPVHLVGGVTALIAAIMLKPRRGRYDNHSVIYKHVPSSNPVNALLGLFMLWWGWLGFNCGSTFGISGGKWKLATRAAANTILSSCGGGIMSFLISYLFFKKKFIIPLIVNGILGALVSVSAICAVTTTWASVIIGMVGSIVAFLSDTMLFKLKIDDPVGASSVHLFCSIWGLFCCGIFAVKDQIQNEFSFHYGIAWGGDWYLLGVQTLAIVVIIAWTAITSGCLLKVIDLTIGLRVSEEEEIVGADYYEHNILPADGIIPVMSERAASSSEKTMCFCCFKRREKKKRRKKRSTVNGNDVSTNVNELGFTNNGFVPDVSVKEVVLENEKMSNVTAEDQKPDNRVQPVADITGD